MKTSLFIAGAVLITATCCVLKKTIQEMLKCFWSRTYRSSQTILDAARAVIDQNINRTPKELFTDRGAGEKIVLFEAEDDRSEATFVVETIQEMLNNGGSNATEIAVMYRTNAQSRLLEDAFMRSGLPYRLVGAQRFYWT